MKKIILSGAIVSAALFGACKKNKTATTAASAACPENPRTIFSTVLQGNRMCGNFSMTEYWNQNPGYCLGKALQFAIGFKFNANGTYEQYFTSSGVSSGIATYQQSLTKGTVVLDEAAKTANPFTFLQKF